MTDRRRSAPALADESASTLAAPRGGGKKNLHRIAVQVAVLDLSAAFRRRDVARVHLQELQGGGLRCAARCPGFSTHSLPAGRVCWAKPNHGFFQCQHFAAIIFDGTGSGRLRRTMRRSPHGARARTTGRRRLRFAFHESAFFKRFLSKRCECIGRRRRARRDPASTSRTCCRRRIDLKIICMVGRIFASHKAICAEMRKPSRPPRARRSDCACPPSP